MKITKKLMIFMLIASMVLLFAALSLTGCDNGTTGGGDTPIVDPCAGGHDYNWVSSTATATTDGIETGVCSRNSAHTTTRIAYATGTTGLVFEAVGTTGYKVTGYTGSSMDVYVPKYHNGLPVTSIDRGVFLNKNLTKITLPFVGASATATEYEAVLGYIFDYSTTNTAVAPEGTTLQYAVSATTTAYWYYIPSTLKTVVITGGNTIPENAFYNCKNITSVTLPETLTSIGETAFNGDAAYGYCGITSIVIPASVKSIGARAFRRCLDLDSVTFASGSQLETIGDYAFLYTSISSITLPAALTEIGSSAFANCPLESITLPSTEIFDYSFFSLFDSSAAVPAGLKVIITGGDSISPHAFLGCANIVSITLPSSITLIGSQAFEECTGLTSMIIPEGVTEIGYAAFQDCTGLTKIVIPTSLETVKQSAFDNSGLTTVYFLGEPYGFNVTIEPTGNTLFTNATTHTALYYYSPGYPSTPVLGCSYWHWDTNGLPINW